MFQPFKYERSISKRSCCDFCNTTPILLIEKQTLNISYCIYLSRTQHKLCCVVFSLQSIMEQGEWSEICLNYVQTICSFSLFGQTQISANFARFVTVISQLKEDISASFDSTLRRDSLHVYCGKWSTLR